MMECMGVANSFFLKYGIKEKLDRGCSNVRKLFVGFQKFSFLALIVVKLRVEEKLAKMPVYAKQTCNKLIKLHP